MEEKGRFFRRWTAFALGVLLCVLGLDETGRAYAAQGAAACLSAGNTSASVRYLVPVGRAIGIKLFAEGVLVVGLAEGADSVSAARKAGIRTGDFLLRLNGAEIRSTEHFQSLLQSAEEGAVTLTVRRNGQVRELSVTPETDGGVRRIGAWIRDSMAGIGTMTYYDPASGEFAALGHGINDVDTGLLMPLQSGSVMAASVRAVLKGETGTPGELKGDFDLAGDLGTLYDNDPCGVFGTLENAAWITGKAVPAARSDEVREGKAEILACVSGSTAETYEIRISKIYSRTDTTRNLLVTVTDQRLLDATGGIVQGMSGSPILQNGKLVGAVTHVLVDDPTRGYAILIDNMLQAAQTQTGAAA